MTVVDTVLARVPERARSVLLKHRELLKFALVGGTTWIIDTSIWYALKLTILTEKPITAKAISVIIATIVSYVLNREWSFRTRAGRERHHEAALFFLVSAVAIVIQLIPPFLSRYAFHFEVPNVSRFNQEFADFISGQIIGILLALVFRFWGYKRWVFPDELGKRRRATSNDVVLEEADIDGELRDTLREDAVRQDGERRG